MTATATSSSSVDEVALSVDENCCFSPGLISPIRGASCYGDLVIIEQDTPPRSSASSTSSKLSSSPPTSNNDDSHYSNNDTCCNDSVNTDHAHSGHSSCNDEDNDTDANNSTGSEVVLLEMTIPCRHRLQHRQHQYMSDLPILISPIDRCDDDYKEEAVIVKAVESMSTSTSSTVIQTVSRPVSCSGATQSSATCISYNNTASTSSIPAVACHQNELPNSDIAAVYQHYQTPSTATACSTTSSDEMDNNTDNNKKASKSELDNKNVIKKLPGNSFDNHQAHNDGDAVDNDGRHDCPNNGGASSRFSATPIRVKIRQGLLKILKRRSKSGDRLGGCHEEIERQRNLSATGRSNTTEHNGADVCFGNKVQIKAVLSASSLHYSKNNGDINSGKPPLPSSHHKGIQITSSSSFSSKPPSVYTAQQIIVPPEPGQYEELPQQVNAGKKNKKITFVPTNGVDNTTTDDDDVACQYSNCSSHSNNSSHPPQSNSSSSAFGNSLKSVSTRLFRRRSSGAISRSKNKANQQQQQQQQPQASSSLIVMVSPIQSPVPNIPLPSPPHQHYQTGNNNNNSSTLAKSDNGSYYSNNVKRSNGGIARNCNNGTYENCEEDPYDPLISFVEVTPLHSHCSQNYEQVLPTTAGSNLMSSSRRPFPTNSVMHEQTTISNSNNNNNNINKAPNNNLFVPPPPLPPPPPSLLLAALNGSNRQHRPNNNAGWSSSFNKPLLSFGPCNNNHDDDDDDYDDGDDGDDGYNNGDDDAFHREFSLALSMLHGQSQDLEKALLVGSPFSISSPQPKLAPTKPPRSHSSSKSMDNGKSCKSDSPASTPRQVTKNNNSGIALASANTPVFDASSIEKSNANKPPLPSSASSQKLSVTSSTGSNSKAPVPTGPLLIAQSLEQTVVACEPALLSRLKLEAPFVNRLSAEGVISADFAKAVLQLTDRIATRMALLREVTAHTVNADSTNDDKLHALCSAFKRELSDSDTAILLTSVYGIFKLVNGLSDAFRAKKQTANGKADAVIFDADKSLLVEVLESNGQQRLTASVTSVAAAAADLPAGDEDPNINPNRRLSKLFTERRRLRQLSQSGVFLALPKFGLSVCVVNFQTEFGDTGAVQLSQLAAAFNNIVELSLPNAGIGPIGAAAISNLLLNECCCLKRVNLAANKLGNEGVKTFFRALEVNKSLRALNLGANSFSGDACNLELTHCFSANRTLLELDLSYNDIGDGGASALGFGIRVSGGLEKLRLRRCGLNNGSMAKVLDVLGESKCRLADLDISVNSLAPTCFSQIVHNLSHSRRTISCQLQSCGVSDLSALSHDSLRYFRELDLSNSPVGDAGAVPLIQALSSGNDTLTVLNLNACDFTIRTGRELVTTVISSENVLSTVKLCHNFKLLTGCLNSYTTNGSFYCHQSESTVRVFEVLNAHSAQRVKIYCTLPDANQLLDLALSSPETAPPPQNNNK